MPTERKTSLLIVEDSPELQSFCKDLFSSEGYEVYCAGNGQEALDFLRTCHIRPDLIILDMRMPIMNGLQFRKEQLLDSSIASIPVVIFSAAADIQSKEAQALGVKGFLIKGMGIDDLLDGVKQYTRSTNPDLQTN